MNLNTAPYSDFRCDYHLDFAEAFPRIGGQSDVMDIILGSPC